MKIAICDDNKANIASLEKLLQQYKVANGIELVCDTFYSSIDLIEDTSTKAYDLILLNVLMPGLSGIQTAKEIRLFDKIIKIIFLSSSSEFAVDSYSVGAYGYLLKPVNSDELFMLLDKILAETAGNSDAESLVIKSRASIVRIPFSNIEYVEVMNKTVSFHLNDVSVVDTSASLSDFEPQLLARVEFLKVHRSYLINLRYIQTLNAKAIVTQNGHTIPVSKMLYAQIKEAYMKYLFVNKPSPKPRKRKLPPITHTIGIYRILLVDDDPEQQNYWGRILQSKNCSVDFASDTETATKLAAGAVYDCIVLDVMLFGESSFAQCEKLRELTSAPVVFLSSLTDNDSQLKGFLSGGIDYITKDTPENLFWAKIEARIRLSRTGKVQLSFKPLLLDLSLRKVFVNDEELILTPIEFDMLWLLAEHSGRVYTPEELYSAIWGGNEQLDSGQSIQVHLSRMRRKLEKACPVHCFIETVWGKGYRFVPNRRSDDKQREAQYAKN